MSAGTYKLTCALHKAKGEVIPAGDPVKLTAKQVAVFEKDGLIAEKVEKTAEK